MRRSVSSRVRLRLKLLVLLGFFSCASGVHAEPAAPLIETSAQHLQAGRVDAAITMLESLADEGHRHPDLSFNRALGYQRRVGTASEKTGDLGQAAAAFAEVLTQRPTDVEAQRGLEESQLTVARRNSKGRKKGGAQVSVPLGLVERALLSLAPGVLFWLCAVGSLVLVFGVALRWARADAVRLGGTIASGVGLLVLATSSTLYFARAFTFADARVAVVVAPEAHVLDESGKRLVGRAALAESTLVYVQGAERGLVRLVGGMSREYLNLGQLRVVSQSPL